MDYKTMLAWAERIKARCGREGKTEQQTRDEIFNSALCMFAVNDFIMAATKRKAQKVVDAVLPGPATGAIITVKIPEPEPDHIDFIVYA